MEHLKDEVVANVSGGLRIGDDGVTDAERKYIRKKADQFKNKMGVSYAEYRTKMWNEVKPELDRKRLARDEFNVPTLEGIDFNNVIDRVWIELGGVIDKSGW